MTERTPPRLQGPRILRGNQLVYRAYDVADEIDLRRVEALVSQPEEGARVRLARRRSGALVIKNPPVVLDLGPVSIRLTDSAGTESGSGDSPIDHLEAVAQAKVWDYGVITVQLAVPIPEGLSWSDLVERAVVLESSPAIEEQARRLVQTLTESLHPALTRPVDVGADGWRVFEDYLLHFIEEAEGVSHGADILAKADVAELVLGEREESLSESSRAGALKSVFQYGENDLVVLDWYSALIFDPSGSREVPTVLEFALTHLLELRFYDDLIERRLNSLYDSVAQSNRTRRLSRRGPYAKLARESSLRYLEFVEFTERIDNSLKVVGDSYLAEIFRAAVKSFRIPDWKESITRKMNLLAQTTELLQGEAHAQLSHLMELIIIGLILVEVIGAMAGAFG